MGILLAFAPFIVFVIFERLFGISAGLMAGAAVSAAIILRDLVQGRSLRILEGGTFVLFVVLAAYAYFSMGEPWSIASVRLRVDGGLLLIVVVSMIVGRPFTMQYAKASVPEAQWQSSAFIRVNYVITGVWAAAFAVMVLADLMLIYLPDLPHEVAIVATVVAIFLAFKFTQRYPQQQAGKVIGK